jgi:hypothetical protein
MNAIERIKLPKPDTHCFDTDTDSDVWSYSPELVRETVLTHIDKLEKLAEERLQNCAALVAEVERLRKDAERIDYIEESGNFGVFRYRSGSKGPVLIEAEDGKKDINKSASTLRDAIDAVMKDAK